MPHDDIARIATLLHIARATLNDLAPDDPCGGDRDLVLRALEVAVGSLTTPATAWDAMPHHGASELKSLRAQVARRLAVTRPDYPAEVDGAPP